MGGDLIIKTDGIIITNGIGMRKNRISRRSKTVPRVKSVLSFLRQKLKLICVSGITSARMTGSAAGVMLLKKKTKAVPVS
jgi:hypothetical protein